MDRCLYFVHLIKAHNRHVTLEKASPIATVYNLCHSRCIWYPQRNITYVCMLHFIKVFTPTYIY